MTDVPEVLFVCVHNAGRSQMAAADVVITMGCGDACPIYPGKRYVDWQLPDPAGRPVEAVRPIRDEIARRVRALLAELVPAPPSR
ncbi:MAG: hypothetical protein M3144_12080 [Actinomycetota bacterium]|nr:hypothetical protein [Actinomycetota bacterium]